MRKQIEWRRFIQPCDSVGMNRGDPRVPCCRASSAWHGRDFSSHAPSHRFSIIAPSDGDGHFEVPFIRNYYLANIVHVPSPALASQLGIQQRAEAEAEAETGASRGTGAVAGTGTGTARERGSSGRRTAKADAERTAEGVRKGPRGPWVARRAEMTCCLAGRCMS